MSKGMVVVSHWCEDSQTVPSPTLKVRKGAQMIIQILDYKHPHKVPMLVGFAWVFKR